MNNTKCVVLSDLNEAEMCNVNIAILHISENFPDSKTQQSLEKEFLELVSCHLFTGLIVEDLSLTSSLEKSWSFETRDIAIQTMHDLQKKFKSAGWQVMKESEYADSQLDYPY